MTERNDISIKYSGDFHLKYSIKDNSNFHKLLHITLVHSIALQENVNENEHYRNFKLKLTQLFLLVFFLIFYY